jgi:glycerol-3-phosphate dehydrogenase (NAD(P)+)
MLAEKAPVTIWARRQDVADEINHNHVNPTYLGQRKLSEKIYATCNLKTACTDADLLIVAVPAKWIGNCLKDRQISLKKTSVVLSVVKGLEPTSNKRVTEILQDIWPGLPVGVLTGPNLAREVIDMQPTASVVAYQDESVAKFIQELFLRDHWRLYRNNDVLGCEIAGAAKNVLAIASGIAAGLGFGTNTQASLLTRSLAELSRLGVAMGGNSETFAGLAGLGDLVATCASEQSRNRQVGLALARGVSLDELQAGMHMVAEGVNTAKPLLAIAKRYGLEMPVAEEVAAVLFENKPAKNTIVSLMQREMKTEYGHYK